MAPIKRARHSSEIKTSANIRLPGGCVLELDAIGLPAGPNIQHAHAQFCRCLGRQDEIYIQYLALWLARSSGQLQIDEFAATALVCRLVDKWQLQVPLWLQPIVVQWVELLRKQPDRLLRLRNFAA